MFASLDDHDVCASVGMWVGIPLQSIDVERRNGKAVLDGGEFVLLKAVPRVTVQPESSGDELIRRRTDRDHVFLLPRLGGDWADCQRQKERQKHTSGEANPLTRLASPRDWRGHSRSIQAG